MALIDESERALIRLETENESMKKNFAEMRTEMRTDFISRKEFDPVRNLVFGTVGAALLTIIGALFALIFRTK